MSWASRFDDVLAPLGLDHWGVVSAERYDAAAPAAIASGTMLAGARSVIVVASGGPVFFRRFIADVAEDARRLLSEANPLDAFSERTFAALEPLLGEGGETFRRFSPAVSASPRLDFVKLAVLAGLGLPSEIGLLVHPRVGPWFAMRQAIFTTRALADSPPLEQRMCDGCPAPCRAACPVGLVGPGPFDFLACAAAHDAGEPCASRCEARLACIVAPEMRYDPIAILYHSARARGRMAILDEIERG